MTETRLRPLDRAGMSRAQACVTASHYLHRPVDVRTMPEGYAVELAGIGEVGVLLFGRPEATRCYPWYGSVADVATGRAEVTRWQVLNLSRVWLTPDVQPGGSCYGPAWLPGFTDRRGVWHSTLASAVLRQAQREIGSYYLRQRPPCFLDEPYDIRWLLSYCDTRLHRGTIYAAAGFERYRSNRAGIETWRVRLPALTPAEDAAIRQGALTHPRSVRLREQRTQLAFAL